MAHALGSDSKYLNLKRVSRKVRGLFSIFLRKWHISKTEYLFQNPSFLYIYVCTIFPPFWMLPRRKIKPIINSQISRSVLVTNLRNTSYFRIFLPRVIRVWAGEKSTSGCETEWFCASEWHQGLPTFRWGQKKALLLFQWWWGENISMIFLLFCTPWL